MELNFDNLDFSNMNLESADLNMSEIDVSKLDVGSILSPVPEPGEVGATFTPEMAESAVPEILGSKELGATMVGVGHWVSNIPKGIKQILGVDEESMAQDEKYMDALFESKKLGSYAVGGEVLGAVAEVALGGIATKALQGAKAVAGVATGVAGLTSKQKAVRAAVAASKGAAVGATYAGIGYVREDRGDTRLGNMALGGTLGGLLAGGASIVVDAMNARAVKKAGDVIADIEQNFASKILEGKDLDTAMKELKASSPSLQKDLEFATSTLQRKPKLPMTQVQAQATMDFYKGLNTAGIRAGRDSTVDNAIGMLSTRAKELDESVYGRLMQHDYNVASESAKAIAQVDPFLKSFSSTFAKIKTIASSELSQAKEGIHQALLNSDRVTATNLTQKYMGDEGVKALDAIYETTQDLGEKLVEAEILKKKDLVKDYFPRFITDRKGLFKELGKKAESKIQATIDDANKTMQAKAGRSLTPIEEGMIIDKGLRGYPQLGFVPGLAKERGIVSVPTKFLKYYAQPEEAMHTHINEALANVEKWKFFGRDNVATVRRGGDVILNTQQSVGMLLQKNSKLDSAQYKELQAILNARFGQGERSPTGWIQDVRNVTTGLLLGNPLTAATQLSDLGPSMYINGIKPTLIGVVKTLTGTADVTAKEMGLVNRIGEDFVSTRKSAKFLEGMLKIGGMTTIDRFGKSTFLNASLSRLEKLATKSPDKLRSMYGKAFEGEIENVILDLKNGNITPNVKTLLWSELARAQPISKSEVTQLYANHPDGRIMYMLKSYMLKQADIVRRDSFNEIRKGNKAQGMYNLAKYGVYLGTLGVAANDVKDWMSGVPVDTLMKTHSWNDIPMNALKTFGYNEFVLKDLQSGSPLKAGFDIIAPPSTLFDRINPIKYGEDGLQLKDQEKLAASVQYAGPVGKMWYMWFGGGVEKLKERREEASE